MNLGELLRETESLTYLNAIKVTLTEIKQELGTQRELRDYMNASIERTEKLIRRADSNYRLVAKLATREAPVATDIIVRDDIEEELEELRQVMEET